MLFRPKEDEANRRIRETIAKYRLDRGMTQQELAGYIQKSQKNLSDIERGHTEVSAADLMYIADQLAVPVRYFLPVNYPEGEISEEEWDVLYNFRRIWKDDNKALAKKLIKEIADRDTDEGLAERRKEHQRIKAEMKKAKGKK